MTRHELKCWPEPFLAVVNGWKPFEYRLDDRGFQVGDVLRLREWDPTTERYTGAMCDRMVRYVLRGPAFGVPAGYCVMGIPG